MARRVYEGITDIQYGRAADRHGWMRAVRRRTVAENGEPMERTVSPGA